MMSYEQRIEIAKIARELLDIACRDYRGMTSLRPENHDEVRKQFEAYFRTVEQLVRENGGRAPMPMEMDIGR